MLLLIANTLIALCNAYTTIIFVYVIMSWIPNVETGVIGQVYRALGAICDPYLNLFRRLIPPIGGVVDITPIIALLVLQVIVRLIVGIF